MATGGKKSLWTKCSRLQSDSVPVPRSAPPTRGAIICHSIRRAPTPTIRKDRAEQTPGDVATPASSPKGPLGAKQRLRLRAVSSIEDSARKFVEDVRAVRATGAATDERSYYPAANRLLASLGGHLRPRLGALSDPAGIEGDFPDVALYDLDSQVLVLPVEVKPPTQDMNALLNSSQAKRYAQTFGGGRVLLTNLLTFILAEIEPSGRLVASAEYHLFDDPAKFDTAGENFTNAPIELLALVEVGTATRAVLREPERVANLLAWHGRQMVQAIEHAGTVAGIRPERLLEPVHEIFESGLDVELEESFFVPTVVQTLIYGLFAAWLDDTADEADFEWHLSAYRLEVPVFAELLHACLRPSLIRHCDLYSRLDATARVLRWVDRASFVAAFQGGAIEYFYEPFLGAFDPSLRNNLGVWYTPREVTDYQAGRIDHELRTSFDNDGLADSRSLILDPACGTGTYLTAVLRRIYQSHLDNGENASVAASRTREAALERVIGFELLPAAFVIAHLHVGRTLAELGAPLGEGQRLRIYLTNSLTGWDPASSLPHFTLFPELEQDMASAREVKHHEPVLAVIGNPPYHGYSSAESTDEQDLIRPWIDPLRPEWGLRKHRMNDLYVRFWRVALMRIAEITGQGVVSFITNRQWLGGRSYPTMREAILRDFQRVVVDDLHGGVHDSSVRGDESVFSTAIASGIRVGVAIVTAVKLPPSTQDDPSDDGENVGSVWIRSIRGTAESKREQLVDFLRVDLDEGLVGVEVNRSSWWRMTSDPSGDFPDLEDYFEFMISGVQTIRDEAVLSHDRAALQRRMELYFDQETSWDELIEMYPGFAVQRSRYNGERTRARLLASSRYVDERIVRFLFRPLDLRWLYWEPHHKLLNEPRRELIPYYIGVPDQLAIIAPQTRRRPGAARPIASSQVPSFAAADPDARVFPLLAPAAEAGLHDGELFRSGPLETLPNVRMGWLNALRGKGYSGSDDAAARLIFNALLGIGCSRDWLSAQPVESDDLPRIPLPSDLAVLQEAAEIGRLLSQLVDPVVPVPGVTRGAIRSDLAGIAIPDSVGNDPILELGRFGYSGGERSGTDVMWNATSGWRNIPDDIWSFSLLGHTVLPKWLSYRVGERLGSGDREEFMLAARRIAAMQELFVRADPLYAAASSDPLEIA